MEDNMGHTLAAEKEQDERCQKAYTNHLSQVNESRNVIASQDIYNAQGILLIKKGAVIDERAAKKIVQYKLLKPLEEDVTVENTIDGRQLFNFIMQGIDSEDDFGLLHQSLNIEDELKEYCLVYGSYPMLVQKLTVLSIQLPKEFMGGLLSAYNSLAIARKLHMDFESKKIVFLAGLLHDIGMLHIDPKIVKKVGKYTPEEWRTMQAHTVIGQKILSNIPKLPPLVAQAVLEHHERTDGAGYPKGAMEPQLSHEGQIVAMSDTLFAIYSNKLRKQGRFYSDLIPIMQMNSTLHFYPIYEAWVQIMRAAELPDKRATDDEDIPTLIDDLIKNFYYFLGVYEMTDPLLKIFPKNYKQLAIVFNMAERLYSIISSNGILQKEHRDWLIKVKKEQLVDEYIEIERTALIHAELRWQIQQSNQVLHLILTDHPTLDQIYLDNIKFLIGKHQETEQEHGAK